VGGCLLAYLPKYVDSMCGETSSAILDTLKAFLKDDSWTWNENKELWNALEDWVQSRGPHLFNTRNNLSFYNTELSDVTPKDRQELRAIASPLLDRVICLCQNRMMGSFLGEEIRSVTGQPKVGSQSFQKHSANRSKEHESEKKRLRCSTDYIASSSSSSVEDSKVGDLHMPVVDIAYQLHIWICNQVYTRLNSGFESETALREICATMSDKSQLSLGHFKRSRNIKKYIQDTINASHAICWCQLISLTCTNLFMMRQRW
jgi:hypothetical protein